MGRVKRVPVVMQMEALECGAASLGMILAYWKKWLPLEQLRIDCGVSRDGSNALNLLKAARKYGMEAKGFRMEVERLRTVEAPAILHWNFCHFVVFNGFKGDKVSLNDPARGRVLVDADEFNRSFTGIVLTFKPGPEFRPSGQRASVLSFVRERTEKRESRFVVHLFDGIADGFCRLDRPVILTDIHGRYPFRQESGLVPFFYWNVCCSRIISVAGTRLARIPLGRLSGTAGY